MKVKTFKRMSKRFISSLLSVIMVLSLFTVCMVGSTITAGAFDSSNITITVDASATTWTEVWLYIGKGDYLESYKLDKSGNYYKKSGFSWGGYTGYFFADKGTYTIADNDKVWKTYDSNIPDGSKSLDGNGESKPFWSQISTSTIVLKTANSSGGGGSTTSKANTGWLPVTLFNYRNWKQLEGASSTETETSAQSFAIDSNNGLADKYTDDNGGLYSAYNTAVSNWFKSTFDGKGTNVTPLYQGNFWSAGSSSYYHFMKLANCANQSDTDAVAQGLVDAKLNEKGNITQLGKEMPQFSKEFMETANTGKDVQSIYENLKFETNAIKNEHNNIWYSYDSAIDGNRSLNLSNSTVSGVGSTSYDSVYGTTSKGTSTGAGFFPFNKPGTDHKNVTNSFGARFDITFVMTKDGTLNTEDLQFNFSGDDDLWVFIDGYLALDMGGSHNKASGYINLNTTKMESKVTSGYYSSTYDSGNAFTFNRDSKTDAQPLSKEIVDSLKDTTREHTLTIFYLERGMFDSNLSFNFMLPQTNSLKIEQKIDTTNVNAGLLKETLNTADKDVHEIVLKSNSKDATSNDTAEIPVVSDFKRVDADGAYALLQKGTGDTTKATGVPFNNTTSDTGGSFVSAGTTTFVWEDANTSFDKSKKSFGTGTGIVGNDGEVDLLYNQSAVFNDQFALGSKFQLISTGNLSTFVVGEAGADNPPASKPSTRTVGKYYTQNVSITDNEGNKINAVDSNGNVITDTTVTDANKYYNFGTADANSAKVKATYTNTVKTGAVKFTKKFNEGTDTTTTFKFAIEFANIFGGNDTDVFDEYAIKYKIQKKGSATPSDEQNYNSSTGIVLNIGDTAIIEGIPIDTKYRIIEKSTSDPSKNYSVASVTENTSSAVGAVVDKESTKGGIVATVGTVTGNNDNVAHFDFNNTNKTTTVVYRFIDRHISTGLPTTMEAHYTYFTREIPGGTLTDTANDKNTIEKYAPTINNLMNTYSLKDVNGNLDIKFGYSLLDKDLKDAEGADEFFVGKKVILATYTASPRMYNLNFTYPDASGNYSSKSVDYPFNGLVELGTIKAPATYTDANGTHNFKYWAKLVNIDGSRAATYTPVSTNYSYSYRVTDNAVLRAVYDNDADYKQLEAPVVVKDNNNYYVSGDGSGYDASAAERVYDSYSKDLADGTPQDRTRINVLFGAVGSKDTDESIQEVGYILLKNTDKYATDNLFTDETLREVAQNAKGTLTQPTVNGYAARVKSYTVEGNGYIWNDTTKKWEEGYRKGNINLTNKNRVNIVFDMKNDGSNLNDYYTCYTFMKKLDYVYDENGSIKTDSEGKPIRTEYVYVSDTPAYFNLREAEPYIQYVEDDTDSYPVVDYVRDKTGKANTNAGNIKLSKQSIKDGQKLVVTITPTNYISDGTNMISTLTSFRIGSIEITEDKFESYTISKTGESVYSIIFDKETHLPENLSTLEVVAIFNVEENKTHLNIDVSGITCPNGKLEISGDGSVYGTNATIEKGKNFILKATPDANYVVKHWLYPDGSTKDAGVTTLTLPVATDDTATEDALGNKVYYTIPTPVFALKEYTVKIEASDGGTVTYSYDGGNGTVASKGSKSVTVPVNTVITLTATPAANDITFTKWSNGATTQTNYAYTVTADATIKAQFEIPSRNYTIYVAVPTSESRNVTYKTCETKNFVPMTSVGNYKYNGTTYKLYSAVATSNMSDGWINFQYSDSSGYCEGNTKNDPNWADGIVYMMGNAKTTSNIADWTKV